MEFDAQLVVLGWKAWMGQGEIQKCSQKGLNTHSWSEEKCYLFYFCPRNESFQVEKDESLLCVHLSLSLGTSKHRCVSPVCPQGSLPPQHCARWHQCTDMEKNWCNSDVSSHGVMKKAQFMWETEQSGSEEGREGAFVCPCCVREQGLGRKHSGNASQPPKMDF